MIDFDFAYFKNQSFQIIRKIKVQDLFVKAHFNVYF